MTGRNTATCVKPLPADAGGAVRRRVGLVAALAASLLFAAPAFAADADDAVKAWLDALASNDAATVTAVLAPEFQIQRSDGRGFTRDEYLAGGRTRQVKPPVARDLVASEADGLLVVRYKMDVEQLADGKSIVGEAPRLTVFRKVDGRWLVVAHAAYPASAP
jgi:ketosteroid isomerase-like protein